MPFKDIYNFVVINIAAIIVAFIILKGWLNRRPSLKPFLKWFSVLILSLWQVGCWVSIDRFGAAFGNYPAHTQVAIVFSVIVLCWFCFELWKYLRQKKSRPE